MILINLLPHRELARKRRKELFNIGLGASALVGGLVAGTMFLSLQAQISSQKDINQILQTDIAKFDAQIKDIAGLEAEIAALRARQQAVEEGGDAADQVEAEAREQGTDQQDADR